MNYKAFNITLPIKENNVQIIKGIVKGDTANIVNVRLMDGVVPFDFTGYTDVFVEILKPDGTHIQASATGNPEVDTNNNPYTIQVIDPTAGRISFTLKGQATILTGIHYGQLTIMGNGESLSTVKFNYYVGDNIANDTAPEEVGSSDEYVSLKNMIAQHSVIAAEERERVEAEQDRVEAELRREEDAKILADDITQYLGNATEYVNQTAIYMNEAKKFAELAQNPSQEIINALIPALGLATETFVTEKIDNATTDHDGGTYEKVNKLILARRGLDANLPALEEGEFGWSTDLQILYVGGSEGAVPINGVYIVSPEAPKRHDVLWIDISANGAIKYYDGIDWQPTATATFS